MDRIISKFASADETRRFITSQQHVIPKEITQLNNIRGINLANNSISSLPYEMSKIPLKNVQLQWNLIRSYQDLPWGKQEMLDWDNENATSGEPNL